MLKEKYIGEELRHIYPNPLPIINTEEDYREAIKQQITKYKQKLKAEDSKPKQIQQAVSKEKIKVPNKTIIIYTDGSCLGNPGRGGWAAIFEDKEISGGDKSTTNNRMELTAVIEALKATPQGSKIELFTDSSYVKNGITSWIHSWKKNNWKTSVKKPVLNKDLWQLLESLKNKRNVEFNWIKGHAGNVMNERCDQLARDRAHSKNTEIIVTNLTSEEVDSDMTVKEFAEKINKESILFVEHEEQIYKFDAEQEIPNFIANMEVEEIKAECMYFLKVITKK